MTEHLYKNKIGRYFIVRSIGKRTQRSQNFNDPYELLSSEDYIKTAPLSSYDKHFDAIMKSNKITKELLDNHPELLL